MKAFNPYAKGIPEKKEFKPRYESKKSMGNPIEGRPPENKPIDAKPNLVHPNANAHGQFSKREYAPPPDKDLLDGLENNLRRQRGWADDEKPNEVVDGISIISISKADLQKKLAAQKQGGFAGGNT